MENAIMRSRHLKKFDKNYSGEERFKQYLGDSGLLIVERNALLLMEILNTKEFQRTRDVIQIDHKVSEDIELTVLVTREAYEFRICITEWTHGSYGPAGTSELWKRFEIEDIYEDDLKEKLKELVKLSIDKMEEDLVTCKFCKKKFPPDHTIDGDVCHGCAVRHLGVVF